MITTKNTALNAPQKRSIIWIYQPQGNGVKQEPQTIEGSDFKVMDTDPLKPRIESREDGIYWVSPRADSQSGEITSITKAGYVLR